MNGLPVEARYPLPPTGQKGARFFHDKLRFLIPKSPPDSDSSERTPPTLPSDFVSEQDDVDWASLALSPKSKATQCWQPGYYLFMSSKLWPTSEELHNMRRTLANQTEVWQDNLDFLRNMRERREETIREINQMQYGFAERAAKTVSANRDMCVSLWSISSMLCPNGNRHLTEKARYSCLSLRPFLLSQTAYTECLRPLTRS